MYRTFKTLRQKEKLNCKEVALYLNITEGAYRKYERSARLPTGDKLTKLKEIFKCSDTEVLEAFEYHSRRKTK